jgi:hypothetical protein
MNSQIPAAASANTLPETKAPPHSPAPDRAATMGWQTMPPILPPVLRTPGRDCAALHLFDCPAVLSRRGGGFEVWVEASYAAAFREVLGELLGESK